MKVRAIFLSALAVTLLQAKLPDTSSFAPVHEKLPATWEACHVFALYGTGKQDRLYTTSVTEYNSVRGKQRTEGGVGFGTPTAQTGLLGSAVSMVPLPGMPLLGSVVAVSHYQSRPVAAWKDEGSRGFFYNDNYDSRYMGPVYRFYKGHHFYTMCDREKEIITRDGWNYEGIAGYLVKPDKITEFRKAYGISSAPHTWFRMYAMHDHFYTTSAEEVQQAQRSGHKSEGVLGHLY